MKKGEVIKKNSEDIELIKNQLIELQEEKKNGKRKYLISLGLSLFAILVSVLALPYVNKHLDKAEIDIIDLGLMKYDETTLVHCYQLINKGPNTAKNVELHIKKLNDTLNVHFSEDTFTTKKDDKLNGLAKNNVYVMREFSSGEEVTVSIFTDFKKYLEVNNIDTLILNSSVAKPKTYYGPFIKKIKHSDGIHRPKWENTIVLKRLQ